MSTDALRIQWKTDLPPSQWDAVIARLNGHPLQTAFWGDARRSADGIESEFYAAVADAEIAWMARVESRRIPLLGRIAWVPKGPTGACDGRAHECQSQWLDLLRSGGYMICVVDPWQDVNERITFASGIRDNRPQTIWIDLSIGKDRLWGKMDPRCRWGVGRAKRQGVFVEQTRDSRDVAYFYRLCEELSRTKRFNLPASRQLMLALLDQYPSDITGAHLFVARVGNAIGSGAFVLRSGSSIHYMWGATDRSVSESRAAEAVQWAIIEWALANGCLRYDLEGIDPLNNPGVYAFKKKLGGDEVRLYGTRGYPLDVRGLLLKSVYGKLPGRRLPL